MTTTQSLVGIQGLILLGFGVFRLYLFLFRRAKGDQE